MNTDIDHMAAMQTIMTQHAIDYIEKQQGRRLINSDSTTGKINGGHPFLFIGCTFGTVTFNCTSTSP